MRMPKFIFAIALLAAQELYAQPPGDLDGYHWTDRAVAYAEIYCNQVNAEYGTYGGTDCANFTSQCANAGCSGMAESNNTNFTGWNSGYYLCWDYHSTEADNNYQNNCNPSRITYAQVPPGGPPFYHTVIPGAYEQSWWLYCTDFDFVDEEVAVTSSTTFPYFTEAGAFVIFRWNSGSWHAMYGVEGTLSNTVVVGHSSYMCRTARTQPNSAQRLTAEQMFRTGHSSGCQHAEVYKALVFSSGEE